MAKGSIKSVTVTSSKYYLHTKVTYVLSSLEPTPTLRWNKTGITVAGITNQPGTANNQLRIPWGLSVDWSNTLYIADTGNNRVQKYLKDASVGETVAGRVSGTDGNTPNELYYPRDVFADNNGNIYIADSSNSRIQLWTRGSSNGITIAGTSIDLFRKCV